MRRFFFLFFFQVKQVFQWKRLGVKKIINAAHTVGWMLLWMQTAIPGCPTLNQIWSRILGGNVLKYLLKKKKKYSKQTEHTFTDWSLYTLRSFKVDIHFICGQELQPRRQQRRDETWLNINKTGGQNDKHPGCRKKHWLHWARGNQKTHLHTETV